MGLTSALRSRLLKISSCELSDALLALGHKTGGFLPDITLQQSIAARQKPFCGLAFTVKLVDASDQTSPKLEGHYADYIPKDSVVVIQAPRHLKNACFGGLIAQRAKVQGAIGVVVDGRMRDITECEELDMPVFARGMSTLGQKSFVRQSAVDIPLEIRPQYAFTLTAEEEASHFPSCIVRSGEDVIFCDSNGVIVLPVDKLEEIIEQAEKIVSQDEKVKDDLLKGTGLAEAHKKHRAPERSR